MPGRAGFVADPAIYTAEGKKRINERSGRNPAPFWSIVVLQGFLRLAELSGKGVLRVKIPLEKIHDFAKGVNKKTGHRRKADTGNRNRPIVMGYRLLPGILGKLHNGEGIAEDEGGNYTGNADYESNHFQKGRGGIFRHKVFRNIIFRHDKSPLFI